VLLRGRTLLLRRLLQLLLRDLPLEALLGLDLFLATLLLREALLSLGLQPALPLLRLLDGRLGLLLPSSRGSHSTGAR
jgi:hypothetical protein